MSTNAYSRHLYAVSNVPPSTKARFAALLRLREATRRALDKALSVPRSAIRWALSLLQKCAEATASSGVLSWLGMQAKNAASVIRAARDRPRRRRSAIHPTRGRNGVTTS